MRGYCRWLVAAGAVVGAAAPALASVSFSIDGTFLQGSDAVGAALGGQSVNPRFSAGLLLSINGIMPTPSLTMAQRNFYYDLNDFGLPRKLTRWWGYAINTYSLSSASYSVAFDDDRADAGDPTYPLWAVPTDNALVIMFDWGVVPDTLRFDLDAVVQQVRDFTFRGVSTGPDQPFPDEENVLSFLRPSSIENGTIGCSSQVGPETRTATTLAGFSPESFASQITARCSVSINVRNFIPVTPPPDPDPDPVSAVPEPATWAMMILGFALVGSAARRRRLAQA